MNKVVLDYVFYHFTQLLDQNTTGILCRKIIIRPIAITLLGVVLLLMRSLPTVVATSSYRVCAKCVSVATGYGR